MCPILLALGKGRRGRHHCAACRRGNRSRAAPGSSASSRVARETSVLCSLFPKTPSPGAGPQSRTDDPLELGGWTRAHTPPRFASTCLLPTRVRHSELLRAPSRVRARRGLEAPLQGRGGANACGAGRAEPGAAEQSRAEPSRAARCRGEAGRACRWLRTHRAAFPCSLSPCLCPGARKTFIVSGSPGVCDEIAALRCRHARRHRRSRGTCNPRPPPGS